MITRLPFCTLRYAIKLPPEFEQPWGEDEIWELGIVDDDDHGFFALSSAKNMATGRVLDADAFWAYLRVAQPDDLEALDEEIQERGAARRKDDYTDALVQQYL